MRKTIPASDPELVTALARAINEQSAVSSSYVTDPIVVERARDPRIVEEEAGFKDYRDLYVIWSKFEDMPETQRSLLILDAVEKAEGRKEMLRVAVAMGLTAAEARQVELIK